MVTTRASEDCGGRLLAIPHCGERNLMQEVLLRSALSLATVPALCASMHEACRPLALSGSSSRVVDRPSCAKTPAGVHERLRLLPAGEGEVEDPQLRGASPADRCLLAGLTVTVLW